MPSYNFYILILFSLWTFILSEKIITLGKNNFINLDSTINDGNVKKWSEQMNKLTSNPINIFINSPGGSVHAGLQFINIMNWYMKQGKIINCIALTAYSMAFNILQHCSNRYVMTASILMQHQISLDGLGGQMENLINYFNMINSISKTINEYVSKRLNMTLNDYKNKINNDWWMTAQTALENNVVDRMVIVGCDSELYNTFATREDIFIDINSDNELEIKKNNFTTNICPL